VASLPHDRAPVQGDYFAVMDQFAGPGAEPEPAGINFADDLLDLLGLDFPGPDDFADDLLDLEDTTDHSEPDWGPDEAERARLAEADERRERIAEMRAYHDGLTDRDWDEAYGDVADTWPEIEVIEARGYAALAQLGADRR
jgi:hypothetical protein